MTRTDVSEHQAADRREYVLQPGCGRSSSRDRAILELMDSHAVGYGAQLPSKLDYTYEWLALRYFDGNELTCARMRDSVPSDLSLLLLGFSDRWATVAARTGAAGALETYDSGRAIPTWRAIRPPPRNTSTRSS